MAKKGAKGSKREKKQLPGSHRKSKPRSQPLPGMEDHAIQPLENVARRYAEIRDERQDLTREEVKLKEKAKTLMHHYGKKVYKHDNIEIWLVEGEEDVKVKTRRSSDEEDETAGETLEIDTAAPEPEPAA
jgi:hypothetical protein